MGERDGVGKELVPVGTFMVILTSIVLAVCGFPFVGAAVGATAEGADFVTGFMERRRAQKKERADAILQKLNKRLEDAKLESNEQKLDLFIEVIKKALEDDEAQKDVVYAAVLEWIARESPKAAHVRILSDAVSRLSYLELFCCIHETHGHNMHKVYKADGIEDNLYVKRLGSVGLGTEGVRVMGSETTHSAILKKYVPLAELPSPNEIAKHPDRWFT